MPVKKDDDGRRSVQVEVEVPGTPEAVWQAIASGAGISSWFVPTTTEDDADGVPVKMHSNFGPGMESVSTVTSWNAPETFSAESQDLGPEAPAIATQWFVEARDGGVCVVRVVHSLFADTDDWDESLEAWESGWPDFFRLLRLYLTHFGGQPCSAIQLTGYATAPRDAAWRAVFEGLGVGAVPTGDHVRSTGDAPELSGHVERRGADAHPEEMLLHLDAPAPGFAHMFAMNMGGQVLISIRIHFFGDAAADVAAREEPGWTAWIGKAFASEPVPSEA
jgi:uncharacterized protein YndB with AHSA1/START domain